MTLSHLQRSLRRFVPCALLLVLLSACGGADRAAPSSSTTSEATATTQSVALGAKDPDHYEFEASLEAPFVSTASTGARTFTIHFSYPGATDAQTFAWALELLNKDGASVQKWVGESAYAGKPLSVDVTWAGRVGKQASLADGSYKVQLSAAVADPAAAKSAAGSQSERVDKLLALGHGRIEQAWDIQLGNPAKPTMPAFNALRVANAAAASTDRERAQSVAATSSLPYTVYYTNLHSQTNDSDGGGAVSTCSSSQPAQSGAYGPADAYAYAKAAGLDALMTSEHNHYFDGSSGTNASGSGATARSRYKAGLTAASSYNTANPGFLAIYGMEWGVISNGGHLNIFNSNELFSWEYNSSNDLFGDRFTTKSDYAALYSTMRQLGLVGQFNHPDTTGQFIISGTDLAYSADGDEVMVLAEILNTSAFSANTTETETSRSSYEAAYKKLLERGFHVAPSTDQDNHCANWGKSYTNRTGVLIPNGTALSLTSFIEALKARRVFATMDKTSQIVLTANGHVMGERFSNSGSLALSVGYASSTSARSAATVEILEGVPGRNGTITTLASAATATTTPATGSHFYYAKVTQDDGKILWSAPVWVTQTTGGSTDSTAPTATASVSGSAGNITLSATASDNVGVSRVDFVIDSVVKGSDSSSPYSLSFDSTTLTNGSHSLVTRAYDAAGNSGASTAVSFTVSNAGATLSETESNGTIANANTVSGQTMITGTMGNTSDIDYFKVSLAANQTLRVDMVGPAANDYDLYLVNASGTSLASSEGTTSSETLSYTNGSSAQTVYIKVISYSGSSTTQLYTLSLSYP